MVGVNRVYLSPLLVSDFVSMYTPLNDETRKLIGTSFFKAMKPTAYFINTCWGATVDEAALIAALQNGEIAGLVSTFLRSSQRRLTIRS